MEITVKLVARINAAPKPLACDCFDLRGKTLFRCPVCDGKGGMKACTTCGGAGMSPDGSRQVRVCPECKGRGYLFHEFSAEMRALIAKKRRERAAQAATGYR
jgi:DnaJ-class molecular chaperone